MKKTIAFTALAGLLCVSVLAANPEFASFTSLYTGVVTKFIGNSGTNTVLEVVYEPVAGAITPFKLSEVTAMVDTGSGATNTPVQVYRVWQYTIDQHQVVVSTNFHGDVITNSWPTTPLVYNQTNLVYDSSADTLPVSAYFTVGDKVLADFDSVTNVILRIIGTAD